MKKKGNASDPIRRIAVLCTDRYLISIVDGLFQYAQKRPHWMIQVSQMSPADAREQSVDAVIGTFPKRSDCQGFLDLKLPVIAILWKPPEVDIPCIAVDHYEIGKMAAAHFLGHHLRYFGFVGLCRGLSATKIPANMQAAHGVESGRMKGFIETLKRENLAVSVAPNDDLWKTASCQQMAAWLHTLPKPAGVFCISDVMGQLITVICRQEGLAIPDKLSILGVNNHEQLCENSRPRLSSIAIPWERIGEEAGRILDRIFENKIVPRDVLKVGPSGIVIRDSTSKPSRDALTEQALTVLRDRAFDATNLKTIYADFPASRRQIERHFTASTGKTLLNELWSLRIQRAQRLLESADTLDWTLQRIAQSSGFSDVRQMNRIFLKTIQRLPLRSRNGFVKT